MTPYCCDNFKQFAKTFKWFYYEMEGKNIYCMPSIPMNDTHWRVNHCPSCGKEIRGIEVFKEEYESFINPAQSK